MNAIVYLIAWFCASVVAVPVVLREIADTGRVEGVDWFFATYFGCMLGLLWPVWVPFAAVYVCARRLYAWLTADEAAARRD